MALYLVLHYLVQIANASPMVLNWARSGLWLLTKVKENQSDAIENIVLSPDNQHVAYGAQSGAKWLVSRRLKKDNNMRRSEWFANFQSKQ